MLKSIEYCQKGKENREKDKEEILFLCKKLLMIFLF